MGRGEEKLRGEGECRGAEGEYCGEGDCCDEEESLGEKVKRGEDGRGVGAPSCVEEAGSVSGSSSSCSTPLTSGSDFGSVRGRETWRGERGWDRSCLTLMDVTSFSRSFWVMCWSGERMRTSRELLSLTKDHWSAGREAECEAASSSSSLGAVEEREAMLEERSGMEREEEL